MQVHAGLGEQRGGVQVVGKILRHLAHGVVIGLGRLPAVRFRIGRESQRHGLDVGLLGRRSVAGEIDRFLDGIVRSSETFVTGGIVVVRAYGLGNSPVRHSEFGVEIGGALKGTRGLVMIEGVDQAQPLIEELLRLRILGGDGMMQVSQSGHQRGWFRLCWGWMFVIGFLSDGQAGQQQDKQNSKPGSHGSLPSQ